MDKAGYQEGVARLVSMAHAYYVLDDPIASDSQYDSLYREILNYERENPSEILPESPTQRIGATVEDGFAKLEHLSQMWSLDDVFSDDEMIDFVSNIQNGLGGNLVGRERYSKFFEAVKITVLKVISLESLDGGTLLGLEFDGAKISVVSEIELGDEILHKFVCVAVNLKPKRILGHISYGTLMLVDSKNGISPLIVQAPFDGSISSKCW